MLGRGVAAAACCTLSPSDNQTGVETQPILLLTFYEQHMIVTQQGCNISTEMLYQINKNLIVCRAVSNIHSTSYQAHTHISDRQRVGHYSLLSFMVKGHLPLLCDHFQTCFFRSCCNIFVLDN